VELWFKDESPTYAHPRRRLLTKGAVTAPDVPYFMSVDNGLLYVGLRRGASAYVQTYNLIAAGVTPNTWHHVAATFNGATRVLIVYLDGIQRTQATLGAASASSTQPLILGRSGPTGDYWLGKIDDLRVWSVVRTGAEIAASYQTELTGPVAGLVGNWHFNEGFGSTGADTAGSAQNFTLLGGAAFSPDVPPPLLGP